MRYPWRFTDDVRELPTRMQQIGISMIERLAWSHDKLNDPDDGPANDPADGPGSYEVDWNTLEPPD